MDSTDELAVLLEVVRRPDHPNGSLEILAEDDKVWGALSLEAVREQLGDRRLARAGRTGDDEQ